MNHFCSERNLYILDCLKYKLSEFFVKEIKVDGFLECTARLIMMKLLVFIHTSEVTGNTEIADIAKLQFCGCNILYHQPSVLEQDNLFIYVYRLFVVIHIPL